MRKFAVVTTFNQAGLKKYGQRMIDSYMQTWPEEVILHIYAEDCNPNIHNYQSRVNLVDVHTSLVDLVTFKNKWKDVPKANGDVSKERQATRKDSWKGFKWDAIRFSHKVYSIFHAATNSNADVLIWMDADMYCHSPLSIETLNEMIPVTKDLCYIGRERKWPECGLYSMNLNSTRTQEFLREFQRMYDDAEAGIFTLDEWHDSYVFHEVLNSMDLKTEDWGKGLIKGEGHPLINSVWGAYLDHLKGGRKELGKSKRSDLLKPRDESYWSTL